jgi:Flp pilus assembly protein TadD
MTTLALILVPLALAQYPDRGPERSNFFPTPAEINESVIRELGFPDPPRTPTRVGPISVTRLTHKVPKKARDAFNRATAFAQKDKHDDAVRELEQAVALDPAFADAYNNLGVQHFLENRMDASEIALRHALELDPAFTTAHINLAYLAVTKNDLAAAEREAQRAIALGDENGEARKILELMHSPRQP